MQGEAEHALRCRLRQQNYRGFRATHWLTIRPSRRSLLAHNVSSLQRTRIVRNLWGLLTRFGCSLHSRLCLETEVHGSQ